MADKKIGNSIFRFEQKAGIDSKMGNWGRLGKDDGGGNENKTLSIKFASCSVDDKNFNLTFEVTATNLKSNKAKIYIGESEVFGSEEAITKQVEISANGKKSITVSYSKSKEFSATWFEGDFEYISEISCDGLSAESPEFKLKCAGAGKKDECFCKQTKWNVNTLKSIITQLRKLEDKHFETQYDERGNPYFIDEKGKVVKSNDKGKAPKDGYKKYKIEKTFYDSKASDGKLVKDRIFYLDLGENIDKKQANYESLAKSFNEILPKYEINTCLRKLHFLTQVYIETQRFGSTYESDESAKKAGEDFYRGRGFVHITHDYGYKEFYKHLFSKEPTTKELEQFVPKVASNLEYAIKSAAWYWKKNNINKYADKDEIEKVSAAINYPNLLNQKVFKSDGIRMLDKRKEYYRNLKNILKYDECK